jgi:hypothetical protein
VPRIKSDSAYPNPLPIGDVIDLMGEAAGLAAHGYRLDSA